MTVLPRMAQIVLVPQETLLWRVLSPLEPSRRQISRIGSRSRANHSTDLQRAASDSAGVDLETGHSIALLFADITVTVRCLAEHTHRARPGDMVKSCVRGFFRRRASP